MAATEDARYRQSSQYRLWSFSPSRLQELRSKTNALAASHISPRLASGHGESPPEFLTPEEETQLLKFYTVELLRAAVFCELPTEIRATAAVFLRRFYTTNSVMVYPPTNLLKTCLFFGSKTEGFYSRLNKFAEKFPNTTPEEIVAGEFLLCQGIRFAFDVRHPFRALEGVILELRRLAPSEETRIEKAHARAREILKFSPLITDAYFHFTPSQIMLAALSMADYGLADRIVRAAARASLGANGADGGAAELNGSVDVPIGSLADKVLVAVESCREMLESELPERMTGYWEQPESREIIRPLLKKLKKCRDPDRVDLVALQKARRELGSKKDRRPAAEDDGAVFVGEGNDSRQVKRRKVSEAVEDPFGPSL